jgi:copper chaperone CopZ
MKKLLLLALLMSPMSVYAAKVKVGVNGMVCSFCAQGIKKKLSAQKGIKDIDVNLGEGLVQFEDSESIPEETIRKIITDAGYTVNSIERIE